ncbi:MAG: hypothetical protein IPN18_16220 [Ignavibacteriales bacterium]|nr:hypothetical protein [Ignavibacteriales bacterium]
MNAPKQITAGFNVEWEESPSDYPSSTYGLSATFVLQSSAATRYTVTATANGSGFAFSIPAATSADYTAGNYKLHIYATLSDAKYFVGVQDVQILPNPFTATGDTREHNQKMLDAINATLEGRAVQEYQSLAINGYSVTQLSPSELMRWRSYYINELRKQANADRISSGKSPLNTVFVKFK